MRIVPILFLALVAFPALAQTSPPSTSPPSVAEAQAHRILPNRPRLTLECGSVSLDEHPRCDLHLSGIEQLTPQQAQDACHQLASYAYSSGRYMLAREGSPALAWNQWPGVIEACDALIHVARQQQGTQSVTAGR